MTIEIIIRRFRTLEPEDIALKIKQFDKDLCTETFLYEIKEILPTPEQVRILSSIGCCVVDICSRSAS